MKNRKTNPFPVLSLVLLLACVLISGWTVTHLVPDLGTVNSVSASSPEINLVSKLNVFFSNTGASVMTTALAPAPTPAPSAPEQTGTVSGTETETDVPAPETEASAPAAPSALAGYSKTVYKIDESALTAPAPNRACYGETKDPAEVAAVIENAAVLLDGQIVEWKPDLELFPDSTIKYYCDDTLLVICWKQVIKGGCYSFAEVKIADGSQLRRAIADNTYGSSVQLYPTAMAAAANAVVAINGDFYSYRQQGITVYQRKLYRYVPELVDSCFFTADGDMLFMKRGEATSQADTEQFIKDNDILFSLAFGPIIIDNGELIETRSYPLGEIDTTYSRAGIGMLGEKHYLLAVLGEQGNAAKRAPLMDFAATMYDKNCYKAYTLDGGQTATIVFDNACFNRVDWNSERTMSDIIYFATAIDSEGVS